MPAFVTQPSDTGSERQVSLQSKPCEQPDLRCMTDGLQAEACAEASRHVKTGTGRLAQRSSWPEARLSGLSSGLRSEDTWRSDPDPEVRVEVS